MKEILLKIEDIYGKKEKEMVLKAYKFMKLAHKDQKRDDNTPFYKHPESVAKILFNHDYHEPKLLIGALLHDVVEDTSVTLDDIKNEFNEEIMFIVDGVTDYGKGDNNPEQKSREERKIKTHDKILSYGKKYDGILLIKIADRIHNLSTMCALSKERQDHLREEAKTFHKKLAERLDKRFVKLLDNLTENNE